MSGRPASPDELHALRELARGGSKSFLVVYDHVPRPDSAGADLRLMQILELLREAGHSITFLGRNADSAPRYRKELEARGIEVHSPDPERVPWMRYKSPNVDLPALLAERRFDVALIYQYFWCRAGVGEQYIPLVRAHSPATRVWLLSDDCHALREERRFEQTGDRDDLERARGLFVKEAESYALADLLLVITREDAARMVATWPELEPWRITFAQDEARESVPGCAGRDGLLFLGSGANDANRRALAFLVEEILPKVRERLPDVRLRVVGEVPRGGWGHESVPGFEALGRADDLAPHFDEARVFVSPVTYGTGLKTKNVQALSHGLPLVLTTISAEGLELSGELETLVHDDAESLAREIVSLCADDARWERVSRACREHARAVFGRANTARDLALALERSFARAPRTLAPDHVASTFRVDARFEHLRTDVGTGTRVRAHRQLAREAAGEGRYDEAATELRLAFCDLVFQPDAQLVLGELHAQLALLYAAAGDIDEAQAACEAACARNPSLSASLRESLARVRPASSASSAKSSPDESLDELRARARIQHAQGALQPALETLLELLRRDPRHAGGWNDLGVLLWSAGEAGEALEAFERALAIAPDDADALANRELVAAQAQTAALSAR